MIKSPSSGFLQERAEKFCTSKALIYSEGRVKPDKTCLKVGLPMTCATNLFHLTNTYSVSTLGSGGPPAENVSVRDLLFGVAVRTSGPAPRSIGLGKSNLSQPLSLSDPGIIAIVD